jgi:ketosteroid isomerase-like protein
MAAGNMDVVQAIFEAWFRGDERAMLERIDREVVVTQFPEQPDVRPYHGHRGLAEVVADWTGTWDDYAIEVDDMRELGERVLVSIRQRGRGKGSGVQIQAKTWFVFTLRAGKVVRWQMFSSEDEALEAIG